MIERFLNMIGSLGQWGYLIIFLAAILESSAFMGLLVPGESIVVLSGFLASEGYLDIGDCLWVISLGAVLGDSVGFSLGKAFGKGYFEKHTRLLLLKEKHLRKVGDYFQQHGGKTIFFGRFIGFLRALAPFVAGMSSMPYKKFFIYNVTGGILWAVSFTLLGYFFGQSWQLIEKWAGRTGLFAFFLLLIVAGFGYLYRTLVKRQTEVYGWFRDKYTVFVSYAYVKEFITRHPKIVAFVKERLSPARYLGLHLTVGLSISVVFAWIFGGITEDILSGDPFVLVDQWVLSQILYFRTPIITHFMVIVTQFGGWLVITAGSLLVMTYLSFKRRIDYLMSILWRSLAGIFCFSY